MSALYLYAVLREAPATPLGTGLAGEPLRLVRSPPYAFAPSAVP